MPTIKPTLSLGNYDSKWTIDAHKYLAEYHQDFDVEKIKQKFKKFKDENNKIWKPFSPKSKNYIESIQIFLKEAGFLFSKKPDGIFGYETLAAVRLFQEYMRTIEKKGGIPDGIVGKNTYAHMDWWNSHKKKKVDYINEWAQNIETEDYQLWLDVLQSGKAHYLSHPTAPIINREKYKKATDTIKVAAWQTGKESVHLIGIRRKQKEGFHLHEKNEDLFILALNGKVFYFWGSTVPNARYSHNRLGYPFLIEGQHRYRFGWHLVSEPDRTYKAFRPNSSGILIYRVADKDKDGIINNQEEMDKILESSPNKTVNIHWSGNGILSFSGGCQVIAGASYINHQGALISCTGFSGKNTADLNKASKTKGAYNLLDDLILTYSAPGLPHINYTLFREEELSKFSVAAASKISGLVERMKSA